MKLVWYILFMVTLPFASYGEILNANGARLDYSVHGEGPPLLMLHGGMASRDSLKDQIAFLAKSFRVIALDSRKHGYSSSPDEDISYEQMMRDVISLLDHLELERVHLLGWSDGGIVALLTASTFPERVDRLVILGANYHYSAIPSAQRDYFHTYNWDGNEAADQFPGMYIEDYLKSRDDLSGFNDFIREMAAMWTSSPTMNEKDLARITAKTLIVNGDHDDVDLDHTLSLYRSINDARLFIAPGASHFLHDEKPELWNWVIHDFLTG